MAEKNDALDKPMTTREAMGLFREMISELRKPAEPTEEEVLRKEQDLQMRKQQAQQMNKITANRKWEQEHCTHRRSDGTNNTVFVQNGDYIICQSCQGKIKRAPSPLDEPDQFIYNEMAFYALMQSNNRATFA